MPDILKRILLWLVAAVLATALCGYLLAMLLSNILFDAFLNREYAMLWQPRILLMPETWLFGAVVTALFFLIYFVFHNASPKTAKRMLKGRAKQLDSVLENSRFMTDKERDFNFPPCKYSKLRAAKKDGIPVGAKLNRGDVEANLAPPIHALVIGSTGSGKTTTFISPMVQLLSETAAGSSMILADPKGELFQLHSAKLQSRGYNVLVLDLRDPYSSDRWNPLESVFAMYQEYIRAGDGIFKRRGDPRASGLELADPVEAYGIEWYEYDGKGYADARELLKIIKVKKQKLYDEAYEDLNDLVSVLCPVENEKDPVWEKGARSIVLATLLAMLEDSENPDLHMTKEKFNFYNLSRAVTYSENSFATLKRYFDGRDRLSKSFTLSRQVVSAAETTLQSYMSIALDKMSIFNDEGICALTSATDIDPNVFADRPTALFLKIPDEKDTRHGLAAVFILCIYKALIKKASVREDLSLPRNVYFILDEFGNMPRIEKFDKMITVGRSRKIWFSMVVQSYAQLENVYGKNVADIIKSNCGIKMFIGSNDIETCKEFSELCGNMTVTTNSVSTQTGDKSGQISVSTQAQTRPLIYPSDLQKLNNKQDTGNAIVVTFGNYPLRTKFTPSYKVPLYSMGQMDLNDERSNAFFGEEIFYDLECRNRLVLGEEPKEAANAVV